MQSKDKMRVCPSCHRSDMTSFSKCRFCGTGYDANQNEGDSHQKLIVSLCVLVILIGAGYCAFTMVNGLRAKQIAPIADQVRRVNRTSKPASPIDRAMKLRKLAAELTSRTIRISCL